MPKLTTKDQKEMKFIYKGKPIAKQRPRFARGIAYDPQSSINKKIKIEFASQFRSQGCLKALEGAISAQIDIQCPIPKSWSKKRRIEALDQFVTSKTGDIDNVIKQVFDNLNNIAYHDDAQIAKVYAQKTYSNDPGVRIVLTEIDPQKENQNAC